MQVRTRKVYKTGPAEKDLEKAIHCFELAREQIRGGM
jgi:hypothetical protein